MKKARRHMHDRGDLSGDTPSGFGKAPKICGCTICGKDLYNGDKAYATTLGEISVLHGGFVEDEMEAYLTVACASCGEKISEAIGKIREGG